MQQPLIDRLGARFAPLVSRRLTLLILMLVRISLYAARTGLLIGVERHPERASLNTIADPRLGQTGPRRHHFQP